MVRPPTAFKPESLNTVNKVSELSGRGACAGAGGGGGPALPGGRALEAARVLRQSAMCNLTVVSID